MREDPGSYGGGIQAGKTWQEREETLDWGGGDIRGVHPGKIEGNISDTRNMMGVF